MCARNRCGTSTCQSKAEAKFTRKKITSVSVLKSKNNKITKTKNKQKTNKKLEERKQKQKQKEKKVPLANIQVLANWYRIFHILVGLGKVNCIYDFRSVCNSNL
jgi:hypothetical protein